MSESEKQQQENAKLRRQLVQMSDLLEAKKAEERLPKNMDFVQVTRSELLAISELASKSRLAFQVLMIMAQVMDKQNAVMISNAAMQQMTNKSRPSIDRAIRLLKTDKWVQVVKVGSSNAYVLNSAVFWTSSGNAKFGSFNAKVVTTFDEQDKDFRKHPDIKLKRVPRVVPPETASVVEDREEEPGQQTDLQID